MTILLEEVSIVAVHAVLGQYGYIVTDQGGVLMKRFAFLAAFCVLVVVGCQQNPPPQNINVQPAAPAATPQSNTTIIIQKQGKPAPTPPVIITPPAPRPGVNININPSHSQCSPHRHCGKCDVCRRNGWVGVNINIR
jgi:hypothetical protein